MGGGTYKGLNAVPNVRFNAIKANNKHLIVPLNAQEDEKSGQEKTTWAEVMKFLHNAFQQNPNIKFK